MEALLFGSAGSINHQVNCASNTALINHNPVVAMLIATGAEAKFLPVRLFRKGNLGHFIIIVLLDLCS